ncbi:hypothetical protein BDZ97DRAFT_520806 [Flammula alnicola]|nr:hypothetical protein BDZ97DRAFT_520806 [Flammula alnicola]
MTCPTLFQYISARLLMGTTQEHKTGDDLESFVHVLTTVAIQYAQNALTPHDRGYLLEKYDHIVDGIGGNGKAELFRGDSPSITNIRLGKKPLSAVLQKIYSGFGHRYGSLAQETLRMTDKQAAEAAVEKLETHEWLYEVLEKSLNNEEWKAAGDGRVDQEVVGRSEHLRAAHQKRKSMLREPEYDEECDKKRSKRH